MPSNYQIACPCRERTNNRVVLSAGFSWERKIGVLNVGVFLGMNHFQIVPTQICHCSVQVAALCGQHCLNALLQGPYFTEVDLAQVNGAALFRQSSIY